MTKNSKKKWQQEEMKVLMTTITVNNGPRQMSWMLQPFAILLDLLYGFDKNTLYKSKLLFVFVFNFIYTVTPVCNSHSG